jgi:DNA-binding MarR family transcriptional regulator
VRVDPDFAEEFPDGDATSTEAHATLVRTGVALVQDIERCVRASFDMTQAASTALAVIDGAAAPLTPSQISERVIVASATMTATLDLLEGRGWVVRLPNPDDRRSYLVEITAAGREVVDQMLAGIRAIEVATLSALTPKERTTLISLLAKVLDRAAEVAAAPPTPLEGRRHRPGRLERPTP